MSNNLGTMWSNHKSFNKQRTVVKNKKITPRPKKKVYLSPKKKESSASRAYWGTPTWYLFHTIAEKIDNNFYLKNYMLIWNFIKDVCSNLPCPFCKNHAIDYISKVNICDIKTKEGLKKVLFEFHNNANKNSRKPISDITVLNKYKTSNTIKIFNYFEERFFKSYIGNRQFTDWIKNALKIRFKEFCDEIKDYIY